MQNSLLTTGRELRVITLRETPVESTLLDTPERATAYWRQAVSNSPQFNADVEQFAVLIVNTRRRVVGHVIGATGTLDTLLIHPRDVFRAAIVQNASAIILAHNHPSGDPTPSEADIKVTRELIRAGQLIKIDVLDHVIVGTPTPDRPAGFCSLRELGYFYT